MALHAGLVCINCPEEMCAEDEAELFDIVLDAIGLGDLINEGVEITLSDDGEYGLVRYALPKSS